MCVCVCVCIHVRVCVGGSVPRPVPSTVHGAGVNQAHSVGVQYTQLRDIMAGKCVDNHVDFLVGIP